MGGPKFDVTTDKGINAFNGFMGSKSYVEGYQFSDADSDLFAKFVSCPAADKLPNAYRWFIHIAALNGVRGLSMAAPSAAPATAPEPKAAAAPKKAAKKVEAKAEDDDDDFDVFGDDDEEEEEPKETRAEMLQRMKIAAEERLAIKEKKQRTLVTLEVKPWSTETDLKALWTKITTEIAQPTLKWGQNCHLADVAYGIKKICMSFTMGMQDSSDEIIEKIEAFEDEVQSVETTGMSVL
mmetsp:Transcript_12715/g.14576  ORF Transcript_12715/g.14576 Transcript_12715/m.14576 type:complete len:238 (-) Transcript_12715:177-890(-)